MRHNDFSKSSKSHRRYSSKVLIGLWALCLRYDDVPNATKEEIQQYPQVLATFYQQARYLSLVKKFELLSEII